MITSTTTGKSVFAVLGVIGGVISEKLGGFDASLHLLISMMVADYVTGVLAAVRNGEIDSNIGFIGLMKKIAVLIVVAVGFELDHAIGIEKAYIRNIIIYFYVSNEGISFLENLGKLGVDYPQKIKDVFAQLKNREEKKKAEEEDV